MLPGRGSRTRARTPAISRMVYYGKRRMRELTAETTFETPMLETQR